MEEGSLDSVDSSQLHADWINITKIRIICLLIKLTAVFQVATGNSFLIKRMRTVEKEEWMTDLWFLFLFYGWFAIECPLSNWKGLLIEHTLISFKSTLWYPESVNEWQNEVLFWKWSLLDRQRTFREFTLDIYYQRFLQFYLSDDWDGLLISGYKNPLFGLKKDRVRIIEICLIILFF